MGELPSLVCALLRRAPAWAPAPAIAMDVRKTILVVHNKHLLTHLLHSVVIYMTYIIYNQTYINAFMDRRWSSEYHFLSKLYNKMLHRPTNDVVNFRGRGWVECACIR